MSLAAVAATATVDRAEQLAVQHIHGNFRNYYVFRIPSARTALLPEGLFRSQWESSRPPLFTILDVGCNEGDLTMEVYDLARRELPQDVRVVVRGVDIDDVLIGRASTKFQSRIHPGDDVQFFTGDFTRPTSELSDLLTPFPDFNFISAYSTTMWVHLNGGTEGLKAFLDSMRQLTSKSGTLLVEPQDKKSYKTAAKRLRKMGIVSPHKAISTQDIDGLGPTITTLLGPHFESFRSLGNESWGRTLWLFESKR